MITELVKPSDKLVIIMDKIVKLLQLTCDSPTPVLAVTGGD